MPRGASRTPVTQGLELEATEPKLILLGGQVTPTESGCYVKPSCTAFLLERHLFDYSPTGSATPAHGETSRVQVMRPLTEIKERLQTWQGEGN